MVDLGFGGGNVKISKHAKKRWRKRVRDPPPGKKELDERVWQNAKPVRAPGVDSDETRLVPLPNERDVLVVAHHKRDGAVVLSTVLNADYDRLPGRNPGDF